MNLVHVIILALLQGFAKLFPISSLGHTVIIPGLLGWNETLSSPNFVPLVVALHIGTAVALLTFFWRDWVKLLRGGLRVILAGKFSREADPDGYGRQFALVVVGTIPAGLIGLLLQNPLESLFSQPLLAAAFLTLNGAVLLAVETLTRRQRAAQPSFAGSNCPRRGGGISMGATAAAQGGSIETLATTTHSRDELAEAEASAALDHVTFAQAALIGFAQSFALLPGISRSGITMAAGLASGLSHEASARFTFLLATPIIAAAGLLELPKLVAAGGTTLEYAILGGVLAGIAAYVSVRFLMRYFQTNRLNPFAWYCLVAGFLAFLYFAAQMLHLLPWAA